MKRLGLRLAIVIALCLAVAIPSNAQFWGGFMYGMMQGLNRAAQQQSQRRAAENSRRRAEERRRRAEESVSRDKKIEKDGFTWVKLHKDGYQGAEVDGKVVIPLSRKYTFIMYFAEGDGIGYFNVDKGDLSGACTVKGKVVVPVNYKSVCYVDDYFYVTKKDGTTKDLDIKLHADGTATGKDVYRPASSWDTYQPMYPMPAYTGTLRDTPSGGSSTTDYEQRKRDNLNRTVGEACTSCGGSGKCRACNGTKVASGMGNTYKCTVCDESGRCPVCNGTGKTRWNR